MRSSIIIIIIMFQSISIFAQQLEEHKSFIELNERAAFYEVNNRYQLLKDTIYHSSSGFLIYPDYDINRIEDEDYIIIKYPPFANGRQYLEATRMKTTGRSEPIDPINIDIINKFDSSTTVYINGKTLAISKNKFDLLKKTDLMDINFSRCRNYGFTFGILTVPFKLRPKIDTLNFNITTDITLGPYVGITKRLARRYRFFLTIPFTLALSFINIDNNNTSNVKIDNTIKVVPGITWSTGIILQLEDFNIGLVLGKDYASGVGEKWIYNGKWWYSFAIGYNFLNPEK